MKKLFILIILIVGSSPACVLAQGLSTNNTQTNNDRIGGNISWADITTFGARAVTTPPTTTATYSSGSSEFTLSGRTYSSFQNGDGITIYGAGANVSAVTPTTSLSAGADLAAGGTGTGVVVSDASEIGRSTYNYKVLAVDKNAGFAAASNAITTTTGRSSIGLTTCNTGLAGSRSNDTITVTTTAACYLSPGALVHITGTSNSDFVGWWTVATVNTKTYERFTFVSTSLDVRGLGWRYGDSTTFTGGTLDYYSCVHVTWQSNSANFIYYIYGERPRDRSYKLVGIAFNANYWDDFGSPYMDNQPYPAWLPTIPPGTAQNDALTTTITAGGGTNRITTARAAINDSPRDGLTAIFDDAPGIIAAATSVSGGVGGGPSGTLYVPAAPSTSYGYYVESYVTMPTKMTIKMIGIINLFAPLELPGNINVLGDDTSSAAVQFSYLGSSGFSVYPGAYPGIIISGPDVYQRNIDVGGVATNGGLLEVAYGQNDTWDGGALVGAGTSTSDYLSMPIELISGASGGQQYYFHQMLFNGGPTQILDASWTPLVYYSIARNSSGGYLENQNYSFYCDKCFFNLRGVEQELHGGNGGNWQFVDSYRQGGITPWLLIGNTTGVVKPLVIFNNTIQDTESVGSFAAIGGTSQTVAAYINAIGLYNSSVDGGSNTAPPPFSGYRPESVVMESSTSGKPPNRNTEATQDLSANIQPYNISEFPAFQPIKNIYEALAFQGQYPWYYPLGSPTITSAAVQSGTGVVNDTYQFVVTAIGPEGSESAPSAPSSAVTTTGNGGGSPMSRIQLHWTNPPGTISNNLYVCGIYGKCPRDFRGTALNLTTNSYLFQHDNSNGTPPQVSGTGTTGATPALIYAPKLRMVGPLNDNGVSPTGDMKYVGRASVVYAVGLNAIRYSTTPALDLTKGNVQQFSCTSSGASISPTITGLGAGLEFTVIFVQNSSKACTWNWPAHIYGGMTVSSTLSGINVQKFIVSDNGTDAYAEAAGSVGVTGGTP